DTVAHPVLRPAARGRPGGGIPAAGTGRPPAGAGTPPGGTGPAATGRRRTATRKVALTAGGIAAVVLVGLGVILFGGKPKSPPPGGPASSSSPAPSASASQASKVLLTDDFSARRNGWTAENHQSDGHYAKNGPFHLQTTGPSSSTDVAEPAEAPHGLGDK